MFPFVFVIEFRHGLLPAQQSSLGFSDSPWMWSVKPRDQACQVHPYSPVLVYEKPAGIKYPASSGQEPSLFRTPALISVLD